MDVDGGWLEEEFNPSLYITDPLHRIDVGCAGTVAQIFDLGQRRLEHSTYRLVRKEKNQK